MTPTEITRELPECLREIAPSVGSIWMWEPLKQHAREETRVTAVRWNGEGAWVESVGRGGQHAWNELSRWVEAAVLITPASEDK